MAGANAQGIRAGRAYVELTADGRKLNQALDAASAKMRGWAAGIAGVGAAVAAAGGLLTAPFVGAIKLFTDLGTEFTDMSRRTGVAVEDLSSLKYAAEASGGSLEEVEHAMRHLSHTVNEAAQNSGEAIAKLALLGLTSKELQGLSPDQVFRKVGIALAEVPDKTQRAALAMEIFGRSGQRVLAMFAAAPLTGALKELRDQKLADQTRILGQSIAEAGAHAGPARSALAALGLSVGMVRDLKGDDALKLLRLRLAEVPDPAARARLELQLLGKAAGELPGNKAGAALSELEKRARDLGIVMSTADAAAGKEFGQSLKDVWAVVQSGAVQIGAALAPELKALVKLVTQGAVAVVGFVKEHKELILAVAGVALGIAAAGAAILGVAGVVSAASTVLGALGVAATVATGAMALLVSPAGLIVAGLTAAGAAVLYFTGAGGKALDALGQVFGNVKDTALSAWGGIKDALAAGDLAAAARVAWTGIKLAVLQNTVGIQQAWVELSTYLTGAWENVVDVIQKGWATASAFVTEGIAFLRQEWDDLAAAGRMVWDDIMERVRPVIETLGAMWSALVSEFKQLWGEAVAWVAGKLGPLLKAGAAVGVVGAGAALAALSAGAGAANGSEDVNRLKAHMQEAADKGGAARQAVDDAAAKRRADLEQQRADRLQGINDRVAKAQQDFQDALKGAGDAAAAAAANRAAQAPAPPPAEDVARRVAQKADVHGSFSALAAAAMGSDKMTDVAKNTALTVDQLKKIGQKLDGLQPRFA